MDLSAVKKILSENDGSLPDIEIDFGENHVVADAYALIQTKTSKLVSSGAYYWSKSRNEEYPIRFGDNPAVLYLKGEAEPFHVVFGGIRSSSGFLVPDLGVFVLGPGLISLDYRMGSEWNDAAILGLFELLNELSSLASEVMISHLTNINDPDGTVLSGALNNWRAANAQCNLLPQTGTPVNPKH